MKLGEVDLMDALDPLAGDPVEDAARVLGGLPNPGVPPVAWWLLGVGIAAGALFGMWISDDPVEPPRPDQVIQPPDPQEERDRAERDEKWKEEERKKAEEKRVREQFPEQFMDHIHFFGLGEVRVTEPGKTPVGLKATYRLALGTSFDTGEARSGMLLAEEVQLRVDMATRVRVDEPRHFVLERGRVFVLAGYQEDAAADVETSIGVVEVIGGTSVIQFRDGRLQVVCLEGRAKIHPKEGEAIEVAKGYLAWIDENGRRGKPYDVDFMEQHTSWMTQLLILQDDTRELKERVERMVSAYFDNENRRAAKKELRRLGGACVPLMVERLAEWRWTGDPFSRDTARLICNMTDVLMVRYLFPLLQNADPEIRVIAYTRIYDITDENVGTGDRFWRDESTTREERAKAIEEWKQALSK